MVAINETMVSKNGITLQRTKIRNVRQIRKKNKKNELCFL